ncbi:uncharacterized protein At5g19025-like [Coffea arabica]|uniref:Uncharacterized protein At5g19025-like n=1 Tax=Coffea arabica TaxID=13443 RepID=A0A6P6WL62_COFAR|nr:uncharacterized protein At5g19025-like [Coffea arabica]XP_027119604.1 uncharacterized protein At5g19025-like [Coffea arabica]
MRHHLLFSTITMAPVTTSASSSTTHSSPSKPLKKPTNPTSLNSQNCPSSASNSHSLCKHSSPSATLDLLILILVLFAGAFLISSCFSYIFHSLSLLLPPSSSLSLSTLLSYLYSHLQVHHIFFTSLILSLVFMLIFFEICCGPRSRKCGKLGCKGLKKAMEFDLQLQGEDCLKLGKGNKAVQEIDELPWKGGNEFNPDYECLRAELRKMAPPNGRAVLLFRAKCGCPVAKLEGWGPKRSSRRKKSLALYGAGDHR